MTLDWAAHRDGSPLVYFADRSNHRREDGTYPNSSEAYYAVYCLDYPVPDARSLRAQSPRFREASPTFGDSLLSSMMVCASWGASAAKLPPPRAQGAPPILVIGTEGDPSTPVEWAAAMTSQLASAVLLTYDGGGHCAYGRGSRCADAAVESYLRGAPPPASGTRCAPDQPLPRFANLTSAQFSSVRPPSPWR